MSGSEGRRKRLLQIASAAAFLTVAVVLVLIVISSNKTSGGDTSLEEVGLVRSQLKGIPQSGMVLGDPRAKVTLLEFGDLQCPVCKGFAEEIVPNVIDSKVRSGEAKLEFKNFIVISGESLVAGAAALAAGEQRRGWSYVELFYRNQGPEASGYVTDEFLIEIARRAGVPDIARWNRDRRSDATLAEVKRTTEEAEKLGFTGTPSFAVEGPGSNGLETLGTPGSPGALEEAIVAAG